MRFVLVGCLVLAVPAILLAESYAPLALPKEGSKADVGQIEITKNNVPEKEAVEAPPYPNARIIGAGPASEMKVGGVTRRILPMVTLVSKDEVEKVVAFYKKKLEGWNYAHEYGMFHVFWKGTKEQKNMTAPEVPTVVITDTDGSAANEQHLQGLKTRIVVYYGKKK